MLLQLNDNVSKEYGDAKLIRKNSIVNFKYEPIDARKYVRNDPHQGFITLKASQSIKTHEELNFVYGDKIKLDAFDKELTVVNTSKDIKNKPQMMFMQNSFSVEYILDLA